MSLNPLVSILMTSYNRERFIGEAIESVLASTYQNFELIVVDDQSSDNTVKVIKGYQAKDSRIQLYTNDFQLGDYPNRNKAASFAKGKYLKYVDSDDYIYPYGLQMMVETMERFPEASFGICTEPKAYEWQPFPLELTPHQSFVHHYLGEGIFYRSAVSVIIRRDIFEKANGFLALRMVSDLELWLRIAQEHNTVLLPDGLVWIRQHTDREWQHHKQYLKLYEKIKLHYLNNDQCPLERETVKKVLKTRKKLLLTQTIYSFLKFQWRRGIEHLQLLMLYSNFRTIQFKSSHKTEDDTLGVFQIADQSLAQK